MNIVTQFLSSLVKGTSHVEWVCVNGLSLETVWDHHSSKHSATLWGKKTIALSLHLRTEINILHICAALSVFKDLSPEKMLHDNASL